MFTFAFTRETESIYLHISVLQYYIKYSVTMIYQVPCYNNISSSVTMIYQVQCYNNISSTVSQ